MLVITNTKIRRYGSEYKMVTEDMIEELRRVVPLFNERSKVAHILGIEKDPDFGVEGSDGWQTLHITFEYFGDGKPEGRAIVRLTQFLCKYKGVRFYHTFDERAYRQGCSERLREYHCKWYAANKKKASIQKREYHAKNKEKIRKKQREYCDKNREKLRKKQREYYAKHREKLREKSREYYAKHREELSKRNREYYAKHREELLEKNRKYYAKRKEKIMEVLFDSYNKHED